MYNQNLMFFLRTLFLMTWMGMAWAQPASWSIHMGSFHHQVHARRLQQDLAHRLHQPVNIKKLGEYYVVLIEDKDYPQVATLKLQLKQMGFPDTAIKKAYVKPSLHNEVNVNVPAVKTFLHAHRLPRTRPQPAIIHMQGQKPIQQQMVLSQRDAVLIALRHNPQVTNAEIDRIIQKYQLQQAAREFQWQYDLTASTSYATSRIDGKRQRDNESYRINPSASRKTLLGSTLDVTIPQSWPSGHQPAATVTLSQPLLRGLNREVIEKGVNDALDNEKINKLQLKQQIMDVVARVLKTYRSLILANNNVDIAKQSLKEAQKTYTNNAAQIRLGKLAETVNISQKSQIANLKLALLRARNNQTQTRQTLLSLLGLDPNIIIQVPKDITLKKITVPELQHAIDMGLAHNTVFQTRLISYKKDKRSFVKAKDETRWRLDLNASVDIGNAGAPGRGFPKLVNGKNYAQRVGLTLSVPVDDLDRKVNLVNSEIMLHKDAVNLHQAQRDLISQIKNSMTDLQSILLQLELAKQTVELKRKVYEIYQVKLRLGEGSDLDALDAQNALIAAQNNLISTKISYLNALTDLYVLLGGLLDEWKISIVY